MPFPASWTLITVTATYRTRAGGIPSGYVEFRSPTVVTCDNEIVLPQVIRATLNEDGEISVQLPATNDPQIAPQDFTYQVIERLPGGRSYSISVPYDGGPIDLSEAAEVDEVASFASYQLTIGTVDSGPVAGASITGVSPSQILNLTLPESGVSVGDKGDIVVTNVGSTWTIDNGVVTYAKMQNVSATDRLLGRSTAGAGVVEEIPCTAFARTLLDDADATAARSTLGIVDTQPGGSNTQLQYNNNGTFGGFAFTYTAASGLLRYAPTWDNIATTFTAFEVDVTDTNSATASRLLSLKTGGTDRFYVTKRGNLRVDFVSGSWNTLDDGFATGQGNDTDVMIGPVVSGVSMRMGQKLQFSSNTSSAYFDRSDLTMERHTGGSVLVAKDSSATNTVTTVQTLRATSSGTPAAGIGAGVAFEVETANNNVETLATVHAEAVSVTGGAEEGKVVVRVMRDGVLNSTSDVVWFERSNSSSTVRVVNTNGSVPRLFLGEQYGGSGIFIVGTNWTSQGGSVMIQGSKGIVNRSDLQYGWSSQSGSTAIDQNGSNDTGLKRVSAGVVGVTNGSTGHGSIRVAVGSAAAPSVGVADGDSGLYFDGGSTGAVNITSNGSGIAILHDVYVNFLHSASITRKHTVHARTTNTEVGSNIYETITNRGATGTVTISLNRYYVTAAVGARFRFLRVAGHAFRIAPTVGAESFFRADGTVTTAGKYLELASDGAMLDILYDGTNWLCLYERGTINVEP